MIREHEFNTRWWGKPVGMVDDADFFNLDADRMQMLLDPFDWVEFKAGFGGATRLHKISDTGFYQVDTQLPFAISLKNLASTPSTERLDSAFAIDTPFTVTGGQLASFTHERFRYIPGCSEDRINERYALWTNELVTQSPETCMQVTMNGVVQGWFLAQAGKSGRLHLTLAMLARDATISGMLLYHRACLEYAALGHRLGEASFSVTNTAVHNMYAMLGARFLAPVGQWLWVSDATGDKADA